MGDEAGSRVSLAIFVGGALSRMGGAPKGLLPHPSGQGTLVEHLAREAEAAALAPCLVGDARAYAGVLRSIPRVPDAGHATGPLAGLAGVLHWARTPYVLTVAVDQPFVSAAAFRALLASPRDAPIALGRRQPGEAWEPFPARYAVVPVRSALARVMADGERSFQALYAKLPPYEVHLPARTFQDWDTPADLVAVHPGER